MSDPSPNEIYARLCKLSTKKRQRELLEYTAGIRTFEKHIGTMTKTLKQDEEMYEAAKASAREEAGRGNVEHAVVHLMDAKVVHADPQRAKLACAASLEPLLPPRHEADVRRR